MTHNPSAREQVRKQYLSRRRNMTLMYWGGAIMMDGAMIWLLALWLLDGLQGAGNAAMLFIWVLFFMGCLNAKMALSVPVTQLRRPKGFTIYHWVSEVVIVGALSWHGHFVLALAVLVPSLFFESARASAIAAFKQGKRKATNNLTLLIGPDTHALLEKVKNANLNEKGESVDHHNFDMTYCTPFLARSIFVDDSPKHVVLENWKKYQLWELMDLLEEFPHVHFYVTWAGSQAPVHEAHSSEYPLGT